MRPRLAALTAFVVCREAAPARWLAGAAVRSGPVVTPSAARHSRTQLHLQFVGSGVRSQHAL
jgi:hypothetical protein